MNKCNVWCTLMGILGFIFGIAYCFTLILIPVAVYCFIGAKKYMEMTNLTDSQIAGQKKSLTNWAIFFSIVGFPIGLLSIIPAVVVNNNIVVTDVKVEEGNKTSQTAETEPKKEEKEEDSGISDLETIEKLSKLKEEGLITEEEYTRAKNEVLNKK